jgi:hypothetical protein
MAMTGRRGAICVALGLALLGGGAVSAEIVKHSGTVVRIDRELGTFVLAEVGPWRLRSGATVMTSQTVVVTPTTDFVFVKRVKSPPSGYRGDFIEVKLEPWDFATRDFVTVECRPERGRMVALRIVLSELDEPEGR